MRAPSRERGARSGAGLSNNIRVLLASLLAKVDGAFFFANRMKITASEFLHLSKELSPATVLSAFISYILTLTSDLPNSVAVISIAAISVSVHLLAILLKARLRERERELARHYEEIERRHDMAERMAVAFLLIGELRGLCKDIPPELKRLM